MIQQIKKDVAGGFRWPLQLRILLPHLIYEKEAARLLGIPDNVVQTALIPVAYYTGTDFQPAKRRPAREVTHWDGWETRR